MAIDSKIQRKTRDQDQAPAATPARCASGKGSLVQKRYGGLAGRAPVQRKAESPGQARYTVQPGDTLGAIARQFLGDAGKWRVIADANGISDPRTLRPEQVLTIPGAQTGASAETTGATDSAQQPEPQSSPVVHMVQRGETLGAIARRYLGDASKWRIIAEANGIDDPKQLQIGQALTIPGASAGSGQSTEPSSGTSGETTGQTPQQGQGQTPEQTPEQGQTPEQTPEQGQTGTETGSTDTTTEQPQGNTAGVHTVTDPRAIVRKPPPDLGTTSDLVPAGARVRITDTARKDSKEYVQVEQVLQEGEEGTPQRYGWTSKANLSGFEGGGHAKEHDETLRPDDAILLSGLGALDRQMAIIYNGKGKYLHEQAQALGISTAAAAAVLKVESRGVGFGADGRMIIRFENHVFYDRWGKSNKAVFDRHFQYGSDERWKGHRFRSSESGAFQACHQSQSQEWEVLEFARGLSNDPALMSISMGAAQIMGFNFATEGYGSVQEMFDHMSGAIKPQLVGMFTFIQNTPLCINGLREGDYVKFARGYNGAGQAQKYGDLIKDAAASYARVTRGMRYGA
jgi:LysM repeat protein